MKIYEISGKCRLSFAEETPGAECENLTIDAVIPGNVELDLERAGILPELFFGNNIKLLRKYEYYKWRYTIDADFPTHAEDELVILEFCGVDCFADYYLNGVRFGESDNALIPHRFDVTGLCHGGKNLLEVVIRSTLLEAVKNNTTRMSGLMSTITRLCACEKRRRSTAGTSCRAPSPPVSGVR